MRVSFTGFGLLGLLCRGVLAVIPLDTSSEESLKNAASIAAADMVSYYDGNKPGETPGLLPAPYYWWQAGSMFGSLVDYWYYTGDDQYNNITTQALLFQTGDNDDYLPSNQTTQLGNDDQAFWAFAAMNAAEYDYPSPPNDRPSWARLAQNVFESQIVRWENDTDVCNGGGLKWQIYSFNAGYNIRNAISNGAFFNLGARLALFTGEQSYAEWAERSWNWTSSIGLIDSNYTVWDSTNDNDNCAEIQRFAWSMNAGVFLAGAANMYNYTNGSAIWEERTKGLVTSLQNFLEDNVLTETLCESAGTCNNDQKMYKGHLLRFIASSMIRAPFTQETLMPIVQDSAVAAARRCGDGGGDNQQCSFSWSGSANDTNAGVSEQMNALQVFQTNLLAFGHKSLVTAQDSTSTSNGTSGYDRSSTPGGSGPPSSGVDKTIGSLKTLILGCLIGMSAGMI